MNSPVYPPVDFAVITDSQLLGLYNLYRPKETIELMVRIMDEMAKRKTITTITYTPQIPLYTTC